MSVRTQLVPVGDLTARQVEAWRDLVGRAAEPNPFFEPEYLQATVRHRRVAVTLLMVSAGSDLVACLPLYGHGRLSRLPVPVWELPSVLGVPHVDPGYATIGLRAAVEGLVGRRGRRPVLRLHRVPAEGLVGPALLEAAATLRCAALEPPPSSCPMVRRRPTASYLDLTLRGPTRGKVGQKRRNCERLLGERLRLVDRGSDPVSVERFLALEAAGWKGRVGTAMRCLAGEADFFRAVCERFRAAGRLRVLSLEAGDTSVAMRCDVAAGEGLFSLKTSYDERFRRFSPGLLLDIEAVSVFHAGTAAWLYSGTNGPSSPVFWLYPDRQPLVGAVAILDPVVRWTLGRVVVPAGRRLGWFATTRVRGPSLALGSVPPGG